MVGVKFWWKYAFQDTHICMHQPHNNDNILGTIKWMFNFRDLVIYMTECKAMQFYTTPIPYQMENIRKLESVHRRGTNLNQ